MGGRALPGKDDGGSHKARAPASRNLGARGGGGCSVQLAHHQCRGSQCRGSHPLPQLTPDAPLQPPFPSKYFQGNRPKMEASSSHGPMLAVGRGARSFTSRLAISSTLRRKESFTALRYQARKPVHAASGNQHSDLGTKALADQPFNYGVISASDAWQTQHQQHLRPRRHRCPGQRTLRVQWPRL